MTKDPAEMTLPELERRLEAVKFDEYCRACSDDFWYGKPGHAQNREEISDLEHEIARRRKVMAQ